jgi:hypothetical protein
LTLASRFRYILPRTSVAHTTADPAPVAAQEVLAAVKDTPEPDLDLEQLKAAIAEDARRKRAEAAAVIPLSARHAGNWSFNWLEVKTRFPVIAECAQAGAPPRLEGLRGPRRWLAWLRGRMVLRLCRFITSRQTDYNVELMDLVRYTMEALHDVEARVVQQQKRIRQLEDCLVQLQLTGGPAPAGRLAS